MEDEEAKLPKPRKPSLFFVVEPQQEEEEMPEVDHTVTANPDLLCIEDLGNMCTCYTWVGRDALLNSQFSARKRRSATSWCDPTPRYCYARQE